MHDPEYEVFTRVEEMLHDKYDDIDVTSEYKHTPSTLPHVSIEMTDNYPVQRRQTSSDEEALSNVVFTINIFSNKKDGKKAQCKQILQDIDRFLYTLNFTRIGLTPVPNMADASIYRMIARYRVETDGVNFYRR